MLSRSRQAIQRGRARTLMGGVFDHAGLARALITAGTRPSRPLCTRERTSHTCAAAVLRLSGTHIYALQILVPGPWMLVFIPRAPAACGCSLGPAPPPPGRTGRYDYRAPCAALAARLAWAAVCFPRFPRFRLVTRGLLCFSRMQRSVRTPTAPRASLLRLLVRRGRPSQGRLADVHTWARTSSSDGAFDSFPYAIAG